VGTGESAVSVGYLVGMGVLGLLVVRRRLDTLLLT
jgi:lipooligosaccharide transport system permease protein